MFTITDRRTAPIALVLFFFSAAPSNAQTHFTWTGTSASWFSASAWSPNGVPTATDTVTVNSGTPNIDDSAQAARLVLSGGGLEGDSLLTISHSMVWTGGKLNGRVFADESSIHILSSASLTIDGTSDKILEGRDIIADGDVSWSGSGNMVVSWPTKFEIDQDATFDISTSGILTRTNGTLELINNGVIRKSGPATAGLFYPFGRFENHGTVTVDEGKLTLGFGISAITIVGEGDFQVAQDATLEFANSNYVFGDGSSIAGAGTVIVSSGTVNLGSGAITGSTVVSGGSLRFNSSTTATDVADVSLSSGSLGGTGTINVQDMEWTGGRLGTSGNGGVINIVGTASITGDTEKSLGINDLNNSGRINWSGNGNITLISSVTFVNMSEGVFDIQGDADFTRTNGFVTFTNRGLVVKSAGSSASVWSLPFAPVNNDGEVRVQSGTLQLNINNSGSNSADTGSYFVAENAVLHFSQHQRTFSESVVFGGNGTVRFGDATIINNGMTFSPGASPGILSIDGSFESPVSDGKLFIEIGGLNPGTEYDQLHVRDKAVLSGTLEVVLLEGYTPVGGTRFLIVAADSGATGSFSEVILPDSLNATVEVGEVGVELVVVSGVSTEGPVELPEELAFLPPWPNPAVEEVNLPYAVPTSGRVKISLFDVLGREVVTALDLDKQAGHYEEKLSLADVGAGIYFARVEAGGAVVTQGFVVAK